MPKTLFTNNHYNTPGHAHELTYSCYQHRSYFRDPIACRLFLDSLRRTQNKFNFHLWAYVIMPDHVHLLIWFSENNYNISKVLQAINGTMSKRYSRLITRISPDKQREYHVTSGKRSGFRFWQRGGGFDRNLYNCKGVHASIRYIENNPVRKMLESSPVDYFWSSAYPESEASGKWRPVVNRSSVPVRIDSGY